GPGRCGLKGRDTLYSSPRVCLGVIFRAMLGANQAEDGHGTDLGHGRAGPCRNLAGAPSPGAGAAGPEGTPYDLEDRKGVLSLDSALHPLSWEASPPGDGREGDQRFPHPLGGGGEGQCFDPDAGPVRTAVSVPDSP